MKVALEINGTLNMFQQRSMIAHSCLFRPHASDSVMQMMSTSAMASSASSSAAPTSAAKAQSSGSSGNSIETRFYAA